MLRQVLTRSRLSGPVAALAAGVVALSCGGGAERQTVAGPAPVALQPTTADDGGSLSEAVKPSKTLLCHYDATTQTWSDLNVPAPAVEAHLKHGDTLGSCTPACPCFTAADLVAPSCPTGTTLGASCENGPYSLTLACGNTHHVTAMADQGLGNCWMINAQQDYDPQPATPTQMAACTQLIVSNPHYPVSPTCPQ